jgi:hypothetical protein
MLDLIVAAQLTRCQDARSYRRRPNRLVKSFHALGAENIGGVFTECATSRGCLHPDFEL